jgi:hypothetical protein
MNNKLAGNFIARSACISLVSNVSFLARIIRKQFATRD